MNERERGQRVERAISAFWSAPTFTPSDERVVAAVREAIRVKITPEAIEAFMEASDDPNDIDSPARAFLRALGFEVIEDE